MPGSGIKEALIPLNAFYFNSAITDQFSVEAFYQFEWKASQAASSGTYFSTSDTFGTGGSRAIAGLTGTALEPILDIMDTQLTIDFLNSILPADLDMGSAGNTYQENNYHISVGNRLADEAADDAGQYGVALRYIAESLNSTEFGLYFLNYHSKTPVVAVSSGQPNGLTGSPAAPQLEQALTPPVFAQVAPVINLISMMSSATYRAQFPEDIHLYGFSFNTVIGETSFAGEIAYRSNMPMFSTYDGNIVAATLSTLGIPLANGLSLDLDQLNSAGQLIGLENTSGVIQAGDDFVLWDRKSLLSSSLLAIHNFGPLAFTGLDNLVGILELGFSHVGGLNEKDIFRPGPLSRTLKTSDPNFDPNLAAENYITSDSWGYQLVLQGTKNNIFNGISMSPSIRFKHDVNGNSHRLGNFAEGRKAHTIALAFNYLDFQANLSATEYYGAGPLNLLRDRDFASLSFAYAF